MIYLWTKDEASQLKKNLGLLVRQSELAHKVFPHVDQLPPAGPGDLVFAMGGGPLETLAKSGIVPKNRTISSLRGQPFDLPGGAKVLVSYSAAIMDTDYECYVFMLIDLRGALRYAAIGSMKPALGVYRYVSDFSEAIAGIKKKHKRTGKPVVVALDTETLSNDPYNPLAYIISVQVCYEEGKADLVFFENREASLNFNGELWLRKQIEYLLTAQDEVLLRIANGKYDLNWLAEKWGMLECTTFRMDTTIVGSLLDENRSNSLNVHAKIYTPLGGYDDELNRKHDKSRMDLVPRDEFKDYAGGDADACYRVSERLYSAVLEEDRLARFYVKVLHPAARAYETVERVGWHVDHAYYEHLSDELECEVARLEIQGREILGGRLVAKHQVEGALNLTKASLVTDFMFGVGGLGLKAKMETPKSKKPSTSMDHLRMFKDHPTAGPFVALLEEYSGVAKTYNTYVVGFRKHLRADGKFHPSYFLFSGSDDYTDDEGGAVTGRLSVKDPAIQTIPKHTKWAKKLRRVFIAPPGYLILSNDFAQGELKIAACLSNEENMIAAYLRGIDLHAVTAAELAGYKLNDFMNLKALDPAKFEAIRQLGKAGNFGLIYGMGPTGFQSYAYWTYGVTLTLEEATNHHSRFLYKLYPGLVKWHEKQRGLAHKYRQVVSPLGRIRHLPLISSTFREVASKQERRAINSPVQATLSDMSLWATALLWQMGALAKAPTFGMVHDQNLRYVPEDNWEFYVKQSVGVMENLPFEKLGWTPQLRFTVDSEIGPNLGDLKKLAHA
jgi:DNA polymerase I-like protein with 3'-5' exonuclease and polymerase domains